MPAFSTRNSTAPPIASFHGVGRRSGVTVPTFGFGIRPRGPSTLTEADRPGAIMSRSRDDAIEVHEAAGPIFSYKVFGADGVQRRPQWLRPTLASLAKTATRTSRPVPGGMITRACRDIRVLFLVLRASQAYEKTLQLLYSLFCPYSSFCPTGKGNTLW